MHGCLIVVDYQNDFVSGSLGFPEAERIGREIAQRIDQARRDGWDVLFTLDTHEADYLTTHEGSRLPVMHCVRGTWGHALAAPVQTACHLDKDLIVEKAAFGASSLVEILQKGNYEVVELCGLVADICVLANAVIARTALPQADVVVNAALVASPSEEKLAHALDMMESVHIDIVHAF